MMGGMWPEANEKQRKDGWKLDFKFLRNVRKRLNELDGYHLTEEYIESVLIAAALVEINFNEE